MISLAEALEISTGAVVEEFVSGAFVGISEEGGDVEAVDFIVLGEGLFCDGGDGGEEVDGSAEFVTCAVGGDAAGGPDDAGDALAAFEGGSFSFAEGAGGAAVMFEVEPGAVVGGENKVGVLIEFEIADGVHEAADFSVDVFDDVGVGVEGIWVADVIGDVERDVGHGVGEVEEEGFFFIGFDEVDAFLGAASGDGALIDWEFDDLVVFYEGSLPLGEG